MGRNSESALIRVAALLLAGAGCVERPETRETAQDPDARVIDDTEVTAPAPGYYTQVDASNPDALRSSLHAVIDDHTRQTYAQAWIVLERADQHPDDANSILDVYKNQSFPKPTGNSRPYTREHSWPKSYGFPDDVSSNYPYTDCHHLFLCDESYNFSRGNTPYDACPEAACTEKETDENAGMGGTTRGSPQLDSNWRKGTHETGRWQTWIGRRGDVARAQFYLDVRYGGGTHGETGASEPDLILTNDLALLDSLEENTDGEAHMGRLSTLLQWHRDDPVDDRERRRNDIVEEFQHNRNPFIDHPEWVDCVFEGDCD
ncbi:MAG TPA: endonuclease [Phycisphaerae bacterium]|nr:endonuclease [Phycisphaerae bacterium]